mmetsp:Transcript_72436/g.151290  ORF Transcript_72436/g.151290 Transcript_72436/m.151290 type:complete len:244 (-) Transcript_72436:1289-2020(-)
MIKIHIKKKLNVVMSHNLKHYEFTFSLQCYPLSFIQRSDLEKGDKIILPPSLLEKLSTYEINWPLMFEIKCQSSSKKTNCGVMEFTSDEGCAYLPHWMIEKLLVKKGEKLFFRYSKLEKGSYVKLQPQTDDFLEISNPKAVLEIKLRNFTCLTKSDVIAIEYNEKIFWLNVLEVKPGNSISIIETDLNVDFAPPVFSAIKNSLPKTLKNNDEKIPDIPEEYEESSTNEISEKENFKGKGYSMK